MTAAKKRTDIPFSDVQFGVQRSIRYHDARRKHYELWAKITSLSIIVLTTTSGLLIIDTTFEWYEIIPSTFVILITAFDLTFKPSAMARTHKLLANQFIRLDNKMTVCRENKDISAKKFQVLRQEIELDEPPVLHVLNVMMHNELCAAINKNNFYYIAWHRRRLAHWNVWPPKKWVKLTTHEAQKRKKRKQRQQRKQLQTSTI